MFDTLIASFIVEIKLELYYFFGCISIFVHGHFDLGLTSLDKQQCLDILLLFKTDIEVDLFSRFIEYDYPLAHQWLVLGLSIHRCLLHSGEKLIRHLYLAFLLSQEQHTRWTALRYLKLELKLLTTYVSTVFLECLDHFCLM